MEWTGNNFAVRYIIPLGDLYRLQVTQRRSYSVLCSGSRSEGVCKCVCIGDQLDGLRPPETTAKKRKKRRDHAFEDTGTPHYRSTLLHLFMLKDPRQSYWSQAHTSFVHSQTRAGTPGQHVAFGCTFCWLSLLGHSLLFGGLRALRAFGAMGADCTSCDAVGNPQTCQYTTNNRYLTGIPGMLCIVAVKPAGVGLFLAPSRLPASVTSGTLRRGERERARPTLVDRVYRVYYSGGGVVHTRDLRMTLEVRWKPFRSRWWWLIGLAHRRIV